MRISIAILLLIFTYVSCKKKGTSAQVSTLYVSVTPTSGTIYVNGSLQLTATVTPADTPNKAVTWSTANKTIAIVDETGLVTALKPGTVVITATTQEGHQKSICLITAIPGRNVTPITRAVSANDFLNSIGSNSSISRRGETLQNTINCAIYLGLRWFRVGNGTSIQDLITLHNQTGVRFSLGLGSGTVDLASLITNGGQLAAAGALLAFEGNNEPNNWGITYQGEAGGDGLTWLPIAKLQRDMYSAVKNDPQLQNYPVFSLSENGAQINNTGLQFLTIPSGAGTLMPDGTKYADYANIHNYMYHPSYPGLNDNKVWDAADPTSSCKVDGLYGNYGLTWHKKFTGYAESDLLTLPRVTTETGTTIGGVVTEEIQALNYVNLYLAQYKRGISYTSIYILRDRTDEAGNQTFGFYKPGYVPRKAAHYLHNLTTILADNSSIPNPGQLNYSIPGQPYTVHEILLQKNNGKFELVVWGEQLAGYNNVTVNLGASYPSVTIYDTTIGTSAIRSLSSVSSVTITVSDHPIIIEI
jgi:hypothetical protein